MSYTTQAKVQGKLDWVDFTSAPWSSIDWDDLLDQVDTEVSGGLAIREDVPITADSGLVATIAVELGACYALERCASGQGPALIALAQIFYDRAWRKIKEIVSGELAISESTTDRPGFAVSRQYSHPMINMQNEAYWETPTRKSGSTVFDVPEEG